METPRNSLSNFRVSKLQDLERKNSELIQRNINYEKLCVELKNEIEMLKAEIRSQVNTASHEFSQSDQNQTNYETDEEQLVNDVGHFETQPENDIRTQTEFLPEPAWSVVQGKKKRTRESPGNQNQRNIKQNTLNSYWEERNNSNQNRYAPLASDENTNEDTENSEPIAKPPPIFVDKVEHLEPLVTLLKNSTPNQFEVKSLRNNQVKVIPFSVESYKIIVDVLEKSNAEYHTYKLKTERGFKVILKNMHHSVDTNEVIAQLADKGHDVINIWNIKHWKTKQPLPIFEIELKPNPNNKEIYSIQHLMDSRINFEPPRPKKDIPQCINCQQYGHTKAYCKRRPKCIKCAGDHESRLCSRQNWADEVKCALCNGNHPANYKGCSVYKQIYKIQNPVESRQPQRVAVPIQQPVPSPSREINFQIQSQQRSTYSYAEAVCENVRPNSSHQKSKNSYPNMNDASELMVLLKGLIQQIQSMTTVLMNLLPRLISNV